MRRGGMSPELPGVLSPQARAFVRPRAFARVALALVASLSLLFGSATARAEPPPLTAADGYRVSVLTMGPGDQLVTLFGHDALLVERFGLPSLVYNFGMYTEAGIAPHHILGGTLRYFLHVSYFGRTVASYRAVNRSVVQQVLALDQATARALAAALSLNSKPANAGYAYDFALDNCTTRVRDALDRALGGALQRELRGNAALTYREHALRFTADDWPLYFLFDVGLGRSVDRPLSAWDDTFLPDRLAAELRRIRITDATGTRPLVREEAVLFAAQREPPRERPPTRAPLHAAVGAGLGGLLYLLGRQRGRALRVALGLAAATVGAVVGALGLLVLLLLLTDVHPASHQNFNLLVCPPWAFGMLWTGLFAAFGAEGRLRGLVRASGQTAMISALGVLVAAAYGQDSVRVALLVLPLSAGTWFGARAAWERVVSGATPGA